MEAEGGKLALKKMENWINLDSEYISALFMVICEAVIIAVSYFLAWVKEKLPGGKKTIYP